MSNTATLLIHEITEQTMNIMPDDENRAAHTGLFIELFTDPAITDSAVRVWHALLALRDWETDAVRMSLRALVKATGKSTDTIRRAVKNLEENGYLSVDRKHKSTHTYQLLINGKRIDWENPYPHAPGWLLFQGKPIERLGKVA